MGAVGQGNGILDKSFNKAKRPERWDRNSILDPKSQGQVAG